MPGTQLCMITACRPLEMDTPPTRDSSWAIFQSSPIRTPSFARLGTADSLTGWSNLGTGGVQLSLRMLQQAVFSRA